MKTPFLLLGLLLSLVAQAQHSLRLIDGRVVTGIHYQRIDSLERLHLLLPDSSLRRFTYDELYSLESPGAQTAFFYQPDTLPASLSIEQMHYYVLGQQQAREQYHAGAYLVGGVAVGGGLVWLMPALGLSTGYAPLLVGGVGLGAAYLPAPKPGTQLEADWLAQPSFVDGYRSAARKRRNQRLFLGMGIGLSASMAIVILTQ